MFALLVLGVMGFVMFAVLGLLASVAALVWWLICLPFRLLGVAVDGVFEFLKALLLLPARVLGGRPA
ncbi:MAG TPA: hypothetical protein VL123_02265 [Candidatus Udaeobacter sp.]|nr:hypothetical protein [Candidatus Udaeobacter sp.]